MRGWAAISVAVLVLMTLAGPAMATAAAGDGDHDRSGPVPCPTGPVETPDTTAPRIVELYPNPPTAGNVGEYVVIEIPEERPLENGTISDGHTTAQLSNETGRIAYSIDPNRTAELTTHPVAELDGHLRLAADGDALELRADGDPIDTVAYDRATEGERWYRGSDGGEWWPVGATCRPVTRTNATTAEVFVLPDSPETPRSALTDADEQIRLAGYTFTSDPIAAELRQAANRGVDVQVLLESGPVGGLPAETVAVLDELTEAGVTVRLLGGTGARYAVHHPKYAVIDDRVLVMTENWKPSGVGGAGSRGWGVIVDDPTLSEDLERVFAVDFAGRDTVTWEEYRDDATVVEDGQSTAAFETRTASETVAVDSVELVLAPDNAGDRLRELLAGAEESILIQQVNIDGESDLLRETLDAARRGVAVRILLDASWYVEDENRALVETLEQTADTEELDLEVRLVDDRAGFEKIHSKGVVIDEETAVVGSINWNEQSVTENREVALVLHGEPAASYYAAVFEDDWAERSWPVPGGLLVICLIAIIFTVVAGRRQIGFARP